MRLAFVLVVFLLFLGDAFYELFYVGGFYLDLSRIIFLAIIVGVIFSVLWRKKMNRECIANRYVLIIASILVVQLISISVSADLIYSLKRWSNYFAFFVLIIVTPIFYSFFAKSIGGKRQVLYFIRLALLAALLVSFVFSALQMWMPSLAYREEVRSLFGVDFQRINSYFSDPNFYACFLSVVVTYLIFYEVSIRNYFRWSTSVYILASLLFMFFTGSKGGMLSVSIPVVACLAYKGESPENSRKKLFVRKLLPYLFAIALPLSVLSAAIYNFEDNIYLAEKYDDTTLSSMSRVLTWYSGFQMLRESPYLGVGPGNYIELDKGRYLSGYVDDWRADRISTLAAHSNLLEISVESGFIVGILYLLLFLMLFIGFGRNISIALPIGMSILSFFISTITISYFPYWISFLLGTLIWILIEEGNIDKNIR